MSDEPKYIAVDLSEAIDRLQRFTRNMLRDAPEEHKPAAMGIAVDIAAVTNAAGRYAKIHPYMLQLLTAAMIAAELLELAERSDDDAKKLRAAVQVIESFFNGPCGCPKCRNLPENERMPSDAAVH